MKEGGLRRSDGDMGWLPCRRLRSRETGVTTLSPGLPLNAPVAAYPYSGYPSL